MAHRHRRGLNVQSGSRCSLTEGGESRQGNDGGLQESRHHRDCCVRAEGKNEGSIEGNGDTESGDELR